MWSDWRPEGIAEDLRQLAGAGLQVLRIFPLWPDFQPLHLLRGGEGAPVELRLGEDPLPDHPIGQAGCSETALARFAEFLDLAQQNGLKLVVGLITGWMSGRLFVPPAFEGLNVLTDPFAIQWEVRLVRCLVETFQHHPAILAWDLGNECNVMGHVQHPQDAWLWTYTITSAIRRADSSRPIVSGMHSLLPSASAPWRMQDQGELTDLLTTHPYPVFTPHCDQDPVDTLRTLLHSSAESRFYADIGGKPCLAEEIGTLGPILASEGRAAAFIRSCLFSLWAHDCHGLFWWCAYDQLHLEQAPYDWAACERELGLFRSDRSPKPVAHELRHFRRWLDGLPLNELPPRLCDAVCILSEGQDAWGAAYSSFILAKQAGFDLEFQYSDQPLKPASLYLLPSLSGMSSLSRRAWLGLLTAVEQGAILYVSHNDCLLSPFNQPFGLEVQSRQRRSAPAQIIFAGEEDGLKVAAPLRLNLECLRATTLAAEPDGNPIFTTAPYGRGRVFFLGAPLETALANTPAAFHDPTVSSAWRIYQQLAAAIVSERVAHKASPLVGLTEHKLANGQRLLVAINYSPEAQPAEIHLEPGWRVAAAWYGEYQASRQSISINLAPNDASVVLISNDIQDS